MRGETICLVVFSAVMGMASVGLTSAHPYEPKPEGEITPLSQQIEQSEVDAKIEEAAKGSAGDVDKFKRWVKVAPEVQETSERLKSDIKKERRARREAKLADKEWPNFGDKDQDAPSIPDTPVQDAALDAPQDVAVDNDFIPDEASANVFENLKQAPISEIEPDNLTIKVTIPTLTVDDISSSFDRRINKHAKRFEASLRSARNKNEDRFARFDDDREIKTGEDVREAARLLEDVIAESGIISNLADMLVDIVDDVEFEQDGQGLAINFEGKRLGKLTRNDANGAERYDIEGLGSFMTLVRKTVTVDGEQKTRITIEMDEPD